MPFSIFRLHFDDDRPWWSAVLLKKFQLWLYGWVTVFAGVIAVVWVVTGHMVEEHRAAGRTVVQLQVKARVNAYRRQLEDLTDRFDQVGQVLIDEWRQQPTRIDYKKVLAGAFPRDGKVFVGIFDEGGNITSASFTAKAPKVANAAFLNHHRTHCCDGWQLTPVEYSPLSNLNVLWISHRLSNADGTFAGVLAFAVPPEMLIAFEDDSVIGARDFVSVRMVDGPVLVTKLGAGQPPTIFYKAPPRFETPHGVRLERGDLFKDGLSRYIAWRKHPSMPFVALAAIAEADAMAEDEGTVSTYYASAILISVVLLMLCGGGLAMAGKLAIRREAEEEVRQVYRTATDAAKEGFYMLRPLRDATGTLIDFQFEDVNESGGWLLGSERHRLIERPASSVLTPNVFADVLDLVQKALMYDAVEDERRVPAVAQLPANWLQRRAVKVGKSVALTLRDISDIKAHQAELLELANRDALTGLPNRLWLQQSLPEALRRARQARRQLAVLFIDLDNFKTVNDTLGHSAGDELLKEVTEVLRVTVRKSDQVVRLGGDEFLVVVEGVDEPADVHFLADKIITAIGQKFSPMEGALNRVSASIGISLFPNDGDVPEVLLKHADIAMYQSKTLGRARACWYTPELSLQLTERLGNEQALRKALERDELLVHYQPKFAARTGQLSGLEALVRWQRPERGLVMPASFITLAEDTGLIVAIGERVIDRVVTQLAQWSRAELPALRIAINVSPEQLRRSDVAAYLKHSLQSNGVAASLIEVEITESAMVEQSHDVKNQLTLLRALGVRLVIDDFGSGYSSLSQLQQLDVDVLKMDRGLVAPLVQGNDAEALCRAIIWMASALDLQVVAEGVETVEQLDALRNIGCDELQGFLLAEPIPADDVTALLSQPRSDQARWWFSAAEPAEQ